MTRARALKQVIRARAAKTGERYTTARRHILRELNLNQPAQPVAKEATKPVAAASIKGGLSDAKAIEKTGHDLAHWFAVLDRFGAIEKGHTKSAEHLYSEYGVPGWYCQGITVAYARARGKRVLNQKCDGSFEVSVSKVIAATPRQLIKTLKNSSQWRDGVDDDLVKALDKATKDKKAKGFIIRPDGLARFRYKWGDTTVQFYMDPKGPAKTSFGVQHIKLEGAEAVEAYRARWKAAFAAIANTVTASVK
jgi:hypothetical protein